MISVVIADDHPLVRIGLQSIFKDSNQIDLRGSGADGDEALALIHRHEPRVALLDLRMPMPGSSMLEILREDHSTAVMFMSGRKEEYDLYEATIAGLRGFICKTSSPKKIVQSVVAVGNGQMAFDGDVQTRIFERIKEQKQSKLSDREVEVLKLMAHGDNYRSIAKALNLAPATIRAHMRTIYKKLGVHTKTEAILEAMHRHLLNFGNDDE